MQAAIGFVPKTAEDHLAAVGATIGIVIGEDDDIGRVGHIQFAVAPCQAHRTNKLVGKDLRRIELPVSVRVFQHANAAISRAGFELGVQIEAGRLGDEQATVVGECAEHGKPYPQVVGDALDNKSVRYV